MAYADDEKYQLECKKLDAEVRNLTRPFVLQPGTWITLVTLGISFAFNLAQCSGKERERQLAEIRHEQTKLDIAQIEIKKDSLHKESVLLSQKLDAAQLQFDDLQASIRSAQEQLGQLAGTAASASSETRVAIADVRRSLQNISNASDQAARNLRTINAGGFRASASHDASLAARKEREGFDALMRNNWPAAAAAFTEAENASNGYHSVYELARLLRTRGAGMDDPDTRREVLQTILDKHSYGAPADVIKWLREQTAG